MKIREAHVWIYALSAKPVQLRLSQGEPRRLDTGDSQVWEIGPLDYNAVRGESHTDVLTLDSAGNYHRTRIFHRLP